jgi:hypothetical protein
MEIPPFSMRRIGTLFDLLDNGLLEDPVVSLYPQSFEELEQSHGFVLYSTNITFNPSDPAVLEIKGLADRAQVFVDLVKVFFLNIQILLTGSFQELKSFQQ